MPHLNRAAMLLMILALALSSAACASMNPQPGLKYDYVKMHLRGQTFNMAIADDDATRDFGLMRRTAPLPDHTGMVFIFDQPGSNDFWMKNCFIDLDIVWLGPTGKVQFITTMKAQDETGQGGQVNAQYVLELNPGTAKKIDLKVGDTVPIPLRILRPQNPLNPQ